MDRFKSEFNLSLHFNLRPADAMKISGVLPDLEDEEDQANACAPQAAGGSFFGNSVDQENHQPNFGM